MESKAGEDEKVFLAKEKSRILKRIYQKEVQTAGPNN
jgi:hypothetical protein